jgi:hypothetical protein
MSADANAYVRAVFDARAVARAARKEFAAAFTRAVDNGVDEGYLATELVRDSVAHGEIDALLPMLTGLVDVDRLLEFRR